MTFIECITSALRSVRSNKVRSFLTLIGIVIGVASVIALLSLGEGAKREVVKELQGVGTNLIIVQPNWGDEKARAGKRTWYYDSDIRNILRSCPDVKAISPMNVAYDVGRNGSNTENVAMRGVAANFAGIFGLQLARGRFLSGLDVTAHRHVAVIGGNVAEKLYGSANPVGQHIKLYGVRFTVIGVLETRETAQLSMGGGNSEDKLVYLPVTTLAGFTHDGTYPALYAQSTSAETAKKATEEIRWYLDRLDGKDVHTVRSQSDLLKMVDSVLRIFTAVLGGIGSISLLVGGIGIMNIMLVSVTERTREIGVRKAVGAKKQDILLQFLIESTVLSLLGGILGILFGSGISMLVARVTPVTPYVTVFAVLLSFASAVAVGLISGLYPAWKASGLDPIEALRYE